MLIAAVFIFIFWIAVLVDVLLGMPRIPQLTDRPLVLNETVSVCVAARNEEHAIYKSVKSQLCNTDPMIEWILVNDRSEDQTGAIMDQLAKEDSRVNVVHIEELPAGWLGKNHALWKAAAHARGDLLLFTDGDVHFKSYVIPNAVYMLRNTGAAHLTAAPYLKAESHILKAFIGFFLFSITCFKRLWKAADPRSKRGFGIGAFNLITSSGYKAAGTHKAIKNRPDDDLQLGLRVKQAGLKQLLVVAIDTIEVEWYPSLQVAVKGLEKNLFAGLHYSYVMVLIAVGGVTVTHLLPFALLFHPDFFVRWLASGSILALFGSFIYVTYRFMRMHPLYVLLLPVSTVLFLYMLLRSAALFIRRGGIIWRGTLYSKEELRKKH